MDKLAVKQKNIILSSSKIKLALKILNKPNLNTLFIIKKNKELIGTITDGDLRRGFLKGLSLNDNVDLAMKKKFKFIKLSQIKNEKLIKNIFLKNSINQIPIIDNKKKILDILYSKTFKPSLSFQKNDFIIMAGGFGKRLKPLTNHTPKVMIKVFGKPMIQHIIESAASDGFKNFFISVNYLRHKIENYFGNGNNLGVNIFYIREKKPLGTAGALSLLDSSSKLPIIVVNGDTITDISFKSLLDYHNENKSEFTIVTNLERKKRQIGILETKFNRVIDIIEKPVVTTKINTGIYVINKKLLKYIKKNSFLNMTDLIKKLIKHKIKVISFPIYENWEDLGTKTNLFKINKIKKINSVKTTN